MKYEPVKPPSDLTATTGADPGPASERLDRVAARENKLASSDVQRAPASPHRFDELLEERTVARLARSEEPLRYRRAPTASKLDPFEPVLRRLLEEWPQIKAPRATELLRDEYGYVGSVDLVKRRADDGAHIGLWIAPERGGGTCFWTNQGNGCTNVGHPVHGKMPLLTLGFQGGGKHVNLCCSVSKKIARVQARFVDGDRIDLTPKQGSWSGRSRPATTRSDTA
jgi:hypothetical protein